MLERALGLSTPQLVRGHLDHSEAIGLFSHLDHGSLLGLLRKTTRGWKSSRAVVDMRVWKHSDVLDLEHRRSFGAGAPAGVRIGLEIDPVGRNDGLQPG